MSFRTAYSDFKSGGSSCRGLVGSYRDPTPEEWARKMQDYYRIFGNMGNNQSTKSKKSKK